MHDAVMVVASRSPENSPESKGQSRGAGLVTLYPERGSNPHEMLSQGILSPSDVAASSVQTVAASRLSEKQTEPEKPEPRPNKADQSPEKSPDKLNRTGARRYAVTIGRAA